MNEEPIYYHLAMKGLDPISLSKDAWQEGLETWMCPSCRSPRRWTKAIDITIQGRRPRKLPLNIVFGPRLGVARRDFLEEFGKEIVSRDLYLGRVFNEDGDECVDYATFRGRRMVIVRGVKEARYRTCPECGRNLYFAWHSKTHNYLYPKPPDDTDVFEDHGGELVVSERIQARITEKWRKGFYPTKLKVLDAPLDGFVELRSAWEESPSPPSQLDNEC